jgi:hypothetical protein
MSPAARHRYNERHHHIWTSVSAAAAEFQKILIIVASLAWIP